MKCLICRKKVPQNRENKRYGGTCSPKCAGEKQKIKNREDYKRRYQIDKLKNHLHLKKRVIETIQSCPPCTNEETWESWSQTSKMLKHNWAYGNVFCEDCTPEYQKKMVSQGKCLCEWFPVKVDTDNDLKQPEWV